MNRALNLLKTKLISPRPPVQSQGGFTLVELLLVVGLMGISFGVTSDILLTIMRSFNKTTVMTEIEQQANFVALKLEKDLRNATGVQLLAANIIRYTDTNGGSYDYDVTSSVLYKYVSNSGSPRSASTAVTTRTSVIADVIGGVAVSCNGSCFTVDQGRPAIVTLNLVFTQAQASANNSYTGQVTVKNVIVARNTY